MKHKLPFLDGIRGVASLYVVFCHARLFCPGAGITDLHSPLGIARLLLLPFCLGHYSVGVFIVLSGFLLMLPVVESGELKGGTVAFFQRRARRIMPPYYAALLLFAIAFSLPFFKIPDTEFLRPVTPVNFLAHVFFIHNLSDDWSQRIDGPMWTVATEMQIYLLFPLLLLPLYRRVGVFVTALIALAIGVGLNYLHPLQYAAPWYLGLFAFGMAGATIYASREQFEKIRMSFPFGPVTAVAGVFLLALLVKYREANVSFLWLLDAFLGIVMTAFILYLALRHGPIRTFLESPPLMFLSKFSYSLYLFHLPVLVLLSSLATTWHLSPLLATVWIMTAATLLTIFFCYLAYLLVERHFITTPKVSPKVVSADV